MFLFAQAVETFNAPTARLAWGPILLLGCGGAFVLFAVVAIVIVLVASNSRAQER